MSIAGAVANAAKAAGESGYGAFQLFTASSRSWEQKPVAKDDASEFRAYAKRYDAVPFAHIPYLCNLASANSEVLVKSMELLVSNMRNCRELGISDLVIHMGSHLGRGAEYGIESSTESRDKAFDVVKGVRILLENTSGYKNSIGSTFSEISKVTDAFGRDRVGVCLDTCHAFAAGYELRTADGIESMVRELDSKVGLRRLGLVHLNDAKFDIGSKLDRHWHMGKGFIGEKGFTALFENKAFRQGCFVLETPINELGDEGSNARALSRILKKAGLEANQTAALSA